MSHPLDPWLAASTQGGLDLAARLLLFSLLWAVLYEIGRWCRRTCHARTGAGKAVDPRSFLALVAGRPTVVSGTVHSALTAAVSCGILAAYYANGRDWTWTNLDGSSVDLLGIWRDYGLPLSLTYFVLDSLYYCLPRADGIIFVHHVIMVFCHYPIAHAAGASLAGAGDADFATWLSVVGYTSEVSTALMNYRWYLINTLEEDWVGFGITNILTVVGWAGRVVMFTHLLIAEIVPRRAAYFEEGQAFAFCVMVFGHAGIGLLSLYWCLVMTKGGIKSLFTFKKRERKAPRAGEGGGFTFADEVGGKDPDKKSEGGGGGQGSGLGSPAKAVEEEAKAYVDGTLFADGGGEGGKGGENGAGEGKKTR